MGERGVSVLDVLVALVLLGVVGGAALVALSKLGSARRVYEKDFLIQELLNWGAETTLAISPPGQTPTATIRLSSFPKAAQLTRVGLTGTVEVVRAGGTPQARTLSTATGYESGVVRVRLRTDSGVIYALGNLFAPEASGDGWNLLVLP